MKQTQIVEEYCNTWRWSKSDELKVGTWMKGTTLHVCCGLSQIGDVRVDLTTKSDIKASVLKLPFKSHSFDTVIADPPWNLGFVSEFWNELKRVAKERIITICLSMMNPTRVWYLKHQEVINHGVFQCKILTVYEKSGQDLENFIITDTRKCNA